MAGLKTLYDLATLTFRRDVGARIDVSCGALLEASGIAAGILGPMCLKIVIDQLSLPSPSLVKVIEYAALFVGAWSAASVLATWRSIFSSKVMDKVVRKIATDMLRGALPDAVISHSADSGQSIGLIERLPFSLQIVIDGIIWRVVPVMIQAVLCLFVLSQFVPLTYILLMAFVFVGYVASTWFGGRLHSHRSQIANRATATVSSALGDILRNARRVVLNGALTWELDFIAQRYDARMEANQKLNLSLLKMAIFQYGVVGIGLACLLCHGAADVVAHRMSVGNFVLLQGYAFRLALPLSGLGFVLSQAGVSLANLDDALSRGKRGCVTPASGKTSKPGGDISVSDATFNYPSCEIGLTGITLTIKSGEFVVIVGPNGSGKSTLAQMMAGILAPTTGNVEIGGVSLNEIPLEERHRFVLYVPQYIGLFNRTLRENALYPPTVLSPFELTELLQEWNFYGDGKAVDLDGKVGEQGERLSGGQIQKLELARVAGISAPVVILDESTSALDPVSETKVISTLRARFGKGTTLIMISHRRHLAEAADTILVMSDGSLSGIGSHNELKSSCRAYSDLWSNGYEQ